MISIADRAYAAGLLDGEGCVQVTRNRTRYPGRFYYGARVDVFNTYRPVLEWLQERWMGRIHASGGQPSRFKPCWHWVANSNVAAAFLNDVRPFLKIKRDQAYNAIAFAELSRQGYHLRLATRSTLGRFAVIPDEVIAEMGTFYERSKELNARR